MEPLLEKYKPCMAIGIDTWKCFNIFENKFIAVKCVKIYSFDPVSIYLENNGLYVALYSIILLFVLMTIPNGIVC